MMIGPRKLLLAMIIAFATAGVSSANVVYLADSSAGGNTGADCADAMADGYFNNSNNWSATPTGIQIGPGTTVYLCGTISTNLTFQGNGASGSPVVLDGTNATMNDYINIGTNYWTIQNCTWSTSYATNSGSQAVIQTTTGASASYGTIINNHIDVQSSSQAIFLGWYAAYITIENNYLRVSTPSAGDGFDTDILDSEGAHDVMIEGNVIAMNIGAGDESCSACHDDLTQVWAASGSSSNSPYNWTYRYNNFIQESSPTKVNNQSLMMMEAIGLGTAGYWDVYSNVFQCVSSGSAANGIAFDSNGSGMTAHIYNNTIVENAGACNNIFNVSGSGTYDLVNNIIYNTDAGNACNSCSFTTRQTNGWYGVNLPSCSGTTDTCNSTASAVDFTNYSGSNFTLLSSSPAVGAGTNQGGSWCGYGSGCDQYPTSGTTWPNPSLSTAPTSGAINQGAYEEQASSAAPNPPTGLTASIN